MRPEEPVGGPACGVTNLTAPSQVAALLRRHGLRPRKSLGQSFLVDRNALERIVAAAELSPEDAALEIGAGLGTLTLELARRCRRVVSLEIDDSLLPALRETLAGVANVEIRREDALKADLGGLLRSLGPGPHSAVANIPYYITSPLLERLLEQRGQLSRIVLLVQKEVARRLAARPGSPDYGSLTVYAQFYTQVELVGDVSARAFLPAPKVDSAILRLRVRRSPAEPVTTEAGFLTVVHAAFHQRRKTLANNLATYPGLAVPRAQALEALEAVGLDPGRRGETLSIPEFAALERELAARHLLPQ